MTRFTLASLVICVACQGYAQGLAQQADESLARLPASAKKAYESATKKVQKNRETYESQNEKVMAGLKKELEKINPPVDVDSVVSTFQKGIMELDAKARPPLPPPPEKGVLVFNGHRYKLVLEAMSWEDAKKKCEEMGGHLLTIGNRAESEFIVKATNDLLQQNQELNPDSRAWIGFSRDKANGQFVPLNGQPQLFSNWLEGQPKPNQDFVQMYLKNGVWVSTPNASQANVFYICEWDK